MVELIQWEHCFWVHRLLLQCAQLSFPTLEEGAKSQRKTFGADIETPSFPTSSDQLGYLKGGIQPETNVERTAYRGNLVRTQRERVLQCL